MPECAQWSQKKENMNNTIVKYGETFYGRHMALIPAVAKVITC